ncbi:site-specific DNA-methyltransferase [Parapedobacter sp. 10938]|uniref:site-specific DNA-methyltransferase n=1 Tax=Parapedobacter flavus TaxID=3110225 RepID=UPI002DBD3606|nr:site-specific DNA-methyltransferase [Parapedobacter sp. 10938]MEC3879042.1 site-specific DNA-methyltransferase [Parapedobacter sp. 10938]
MWNLLDELKGLLQQDERLVVEGKLLRNKIVELTLQLDPALIRTLLSHEGIKKHFFQDIGGVMVFDKIGFQQFVSNKAFLPDSYTAFKNRIGLIDGNEFIKEHKQVVLAWPYKDAVLEGGQSKEEAKGNEIFWNETLAPDEIDRLLQPKVLRNFKKYTAVDTADVAELSGKDNFLMKGNNLLTLHTLKSAFAGKIKLIYIDPPYNTGKDSFGYNDSFNHSAWLTFMKNRLEVSKQLLSNLGVLFISIDVNEHAYLKVLCDEIFGRDNFLGEIIWETATDNNATQISVEHEYVIGYAKHKASQPKWQIQSEKAQAIQHQYETLEAEHGADTGRIEKDLRNWVKSVKKSNEIDLSGVSHYTYVDDQGIFYPGNSANTKPGGYHYDIVHPVTKKVCNKPVNGYRWPETTFWAAADRGDVLWGGDENTIPKIKKRLHTATELLKGYFYEDNRKSTRALTNMMGKKVFENPKSINLLKKIIKFTTGENDVILDFFAGSGSTAEAVLQVNREENSTRRFILCEQMDYVESVTAKRIQKCLDGETFIYCELAKLNAHYADLVKAATTIREIKAVWRRTKTEAFVSWRVNIPRVDELLSTASTMDIQEIQSLIYETLDKNQWYVPLSEIHDNDYRFGRDIIDLNHQFARL